LSARARATLLQAARADAASEAAQNAAAAARASIWPGGSPAYALGVAAAMVLVAAATLGGGRLSGVRARRAELDDFGEGLELEPGFDLHQLGEEIEPFGFGGGGSSSSSSSSSSSTGGGLGGADGGRGGRGGGSNGGGGDGATEDGGFVASASAGYQGGGSTYREFVVAPDEQETPPTPVRMLPATAFE
jgi:hypothetical protein